MQEYYLSNELLLQIVYDIVENPHNLSIEKLRSLHRFSLVNKQYYHITQLPEVWRALFCRNSFEKLRRYYAENYSKKNIPLEPERKDFIAEENLFLYKMSRSSLAIDSPMGKELYAVFCSRPVFDCILNNPAFRVNITPNRFSHRQATFIWPHDFDAEYIKHAAGGMNKNSMYVVAMCLKAYCTNNQKFSSFEELHAMDFFYDKTINVQKYEDEFCAWASYVVKNIITISIVNQTHFILQPYQTPKAWGLHYDAIILAHTLIWYLTKDSAPLMDCDRFGQDALIKACRCRDYKQVAQLLSSKKLHASELIKKEDILGFNALYITIMDHSNDIFDLLLEKVTTYLYKKSAAKSELLQVAVQCNNTHAVEKLLPLYTDISKSTSYYFWKNTDKTALDAALHEAVKSHPKYSKMVQLFFAKYGDTLSSNFKD